MPYKDAYHPRVKSDVKRLDKPVTRDVYNIHLDKILNAPYSGEKLYGDLEGVFSYHFRKSNVDYRIAYFIDETARVVHVVMIGKRENFYEILRRRLS
ncbi:MAG: type II toxin-antitoxin system mRNA interferase toxin, RelE/StbE family [Nitrospirota bacterium]